MHMWLLKVNFERVLIVLLSESIRTTWLGYLIDYCYWVDDRYLCACIRNDSIFFFHDDNNDKNFHWFFAQFILWLFMVTLYFSWYVDHYDVRADERRNVNIVLDYYYDYLLLKEKKRQRSTFVTVTIWWTTTQCREKKA